MHEHNQLHDRLHLQQLFLAFLGLFQLFLLCGFPSISHVGLFQLLHLRASLSIYFTCWSFPITLLASLSISFTCWSFQVTPLVGLLELFHLLNFSCYATSLKGLFQTSHLCTMRHEPNF